MSARPLTLIEFIDDLKEAGVGALRVSPHQRHTKETVEIFRARMEGGIPPDEALRELKRVWEEEFVNGWYLAGAGKDYLKEPLINSFERNFL
ncbi:MAG: hypothetical protein HY883_03785 [Deltaproteobacteria bacterium]|nr:hypothetical protein [Deltaproteobacteria bacterium]